MSGLISEYANTKGKAFEKIQQRTVIEFCTSAWGLGVKLLPQQRFILKCFYCVPLDRKTKDIELKDQFGQRVRYRFTEQEFADYLHDQGRLNTKDFTVPRSELVLVIGRRGTKTTTTALLCCYELYKLLQKYHPQKYYGLMPDDEIRITTVATVEDQARVLGEKIFSLVLGSPFFKPYVVKQTGSDLVLRTPRDREVYGSKGKGTILVRSSPSNADSLRGPGNIVAIMDEEAAFNENSKSKSDKAVYDALRPSISTFRTPEGVLDGKIINISSPKGPSGMLWELYNLSRGTGPSANQILMIKAPTWEMNPIVGPEIYLPEWERDPANYETEYGAEFSSRVSGFIRDDKILRNCVDPNWKEQKYGVPGRRYFMGVDVGLKEDGTAIVVCHTDKEYTTDSDGNQVAKDLIVVDYFSIDYAGEGRCAGYKIIELDDVIDWIHDLAGKFPIVRGGFDHYQGFALQQALKKKGHHNFEVYQGNDTRHSYLYKTFYNILVQGKLKLYNNPDAEVDEDGRKADNTLISELLMLQESKRSKWRIKVEAPAGKHDDLSDALVRAVALAFESLEKPSPIMTGGSTGSSRASVLASGRAGLLAFQRKKAKLHGVDRKRPNLFSKSMKRMK